MAPVMSGCAVGQPFGQTMHQMRSDINVLDQRVSQLERATLNQASQPTAVPWSTEPQATAPASVPAPVTPPASTVSPMLKPTKREIQQALKGAGLYKGAVDGRIGPQTREAIKEFQRNNGLNADGVVGRQTWERLAPYLEQSSAELGAAETLK
jgi:peptidoglycan hydrolase-like protein with peptidoglycan-binding domain